MSPTPSPSRPNKRRSERAHFEITYSETPTPLLEQPFSSANTLQTSLIVALFIILLLIILSPRPRRLPSFDIEETRLQDFQSGVEMDFPVPTAEVGDESLGGEDGLQNSSGGK